MTDTPQSVEQDKEPVQLTINDLQAVVSIIDVACTRGAFKANEMAAIGAIYNKISQFLANLAKPSEGPAPTTSETKE